MKKNSRIYIAGHEGLIGSALIRKYKRDGFTNIITRTRKTLDLQNQKAVINFFKKEKPEYIILAAAKVGGIKANIAEPAGFMIENLLIQNNIILSALEYNVKKLLYISCGCAYPTESKQPIKEEYLLTGKPEITNEGFAIAKIAAMKLCEKIFLQYKKEFISCIAANTYGENDHYDENRAHVISALLKRFHEAKQKNFPSVTIWGTGLARREFIYVDDLAEGLHLLMEKYSSAQTINLGSSQEVSIKELSKIIQKTVGYNGKIVFDTTKPDGMKRRVFDNTLINKLGFEPKISLKDGIARAYEYFKSQNGVK
jgi:GDP-L-fucose synthase